MKTGTTSPINAALEQFELERANLAARLAKVDALIAQTRDVFHLPNGRAVVKPRAPKKPPTAIRGKADAGKVAARREREKDAILAALKRGPMTPFDLAEKVGLPRPRLRVIVAGLEETHQVESTGTTASRRIALAGQPKEAP